MCVHLRIPRSCKSRFENGQAGSRSQYHCSSESRHITIRETVFGPRHISIDNDNWDPSQASSAMGMRSSGHVFRRALLASILSHVLFSFPSSLFVLLFFAPLPLNQAGLSFSFTGNTHIPHSCTRCRCTLRVQWLRKSHDRRTCQFFST